MALTRLALLNSAAAAVLAFPLWTSIALAQTAQGTEGQGTDQAQQAQPSGDVGQAAGGPQGQASGSDSLVARLGDTEIRSSDVLRAMGQLPPTLNAQPPEMLAATAIQQLVLREAILQQAREAGLAQDPEVQSRVTAAAQAAEEDALLSVWLERELQTRVPPEAVDQAYAGLQAITTGELPPLEQLRGEIEQNLRRQAMEEIQTSLLEGADVTFFGPDGQPRARTGQTGAAGQGGGADSETGAGTGVASGTDAGAGADAGDDAGTGPNAGDNAGAGTGDGARAGTDAGTGTEIETGDGGGAGAGTDGSGTGAGTGGTDAGGTDSGG